MNHNNCWRPRLDCLQLIGCAPAVKKMAHRHTPLQRRQMSHHRHIHYLLHRAGAEKGKPGGPRRHNILMVAEDTQGMCGQRTRADMEHRRQPVAGNLEHIREHQHQPLRVGERSGKRPGCQGAVRGSGSAKLTLHLLYFQRLPCIIEASLHTPLLCGLPHRGDRSNGVYRGHVAHGISHICGGGTAVHYCFHNSGK